MTSGASGRGIKETFPKTNDTNRRETYTGCTYNPMKTRYNGHMTDINTRNEEHTGTREHGRVNMYAHMQSTFMRIHKSVNMHTCIYMLR